MSTPHKCPACGGTGRVLDPNPYSNHGTVPCQACEGTGIVREPER